MRLSTEGMAKEIQELKSLNTRIELENLRMREALEKCISCADNGETTSVIYWADQALQAIPHTERLAKQREADLHLINLALQRKMLEGSPEFEKQWNIAIAERERVYKGEI